MEHASLLAESQRHSNMAKLLGHSSIRLTADVYLMRLMTCWRRRLENWIGGYLGMARASFPSSSSGIGPKAQSLSSFHPSHL